MCLLFVGLAGGQRWDDPYLDWVMAGPRVSRSTVNLRLHLRHYLFPIRHGYPSLCIITYLSHLQAPIGYAST